jgi:hypothetical protein
MNNFKRLNKLCFKDSKIISRIIKKVLEFIKIIKQQMKL